MTGKSNLAMTTSGLPLKVGLPDAVV
jgi:hypothetical protein